MRPDEKILVLDFGSQYTQLIARRIREERVYCLIHPYSISVDEVARIAPNGIVLSGGPSSVKHPGSPRLDPAILEMGIPVLGICYGLQLLAHLLGGKVGNAEVREYGPARLHVERSEGILAGIHQGESLDVWMSHGDAVETLPAGFVSLARTPASPLAVVGNHERRIYGLQFHPEVHHTPRGPEILRGFLRQVCGCSEAWTMSSFLDTAALSVREQVGEQGRVICGLSGGVDSSVAAALIHKAIGDRLTCIFVDNGLLRQGEFDQVQEVFRGQFHIPLIAVDAEDRFLDALAGTTDPEAKRKIIGGEFIRVFEEAAAEIEGATFLAQGTLYPDVIESVSVRGPSAVIKSHHNVGGLPEHMKLELVEPLRELFKDEVRELGRLLGLPEALVGRWPFPGPGLGVRVLGEITKEKLDILRSADAIFHEEIAAAGLYSSVWQGFVVLLPVRSVGVMGDERTYDYACVLRAVTSTDGMTADWARLPHDVLARISSRIINEVRGINRVAYDISSKPPATIEWE